MRRTRRGNQRTIIRYYNTNRRRSPILTRQSISRKLLKQTGGPEEMKEIQHFCDICKERIDLTRRSIPQGDETEGNGMSVVVGSPNEAKLVWRPLLEADYHLCNQCISRLRKLFKEEDQTDAGFWEGDIPSRTG